MFNILQILLITIMIVFSFGWNLQGINNSSTIVLNDIGKYLSNPIKDIPYLDILLRAEYLQEDTEHPYTRWFLQHTTCLHTITTYAESDLDELPTKLNNRRNSFVIVTNMLKLPLITKRFAQKAGTFFYILADVDVDNEKLLIVLQELWMTKKIFKNFILTADGVHIYDPFEYDTSRQSYGQIIYYTGQRNLELMLFSDMRGYPIRIQFFRSVYARPVMDCETGKIGGVEGVDGHVTKMLQTRMNFTLNFQDPDPNYFGERLPNGSHSGAIGSLIRNEIDICLTGFFVKDYKVSEIMFTVAMYDDQLCIYVAKAKRIPQSILPIFSVGYDLWLVFILSAFVCGTIWWFIRYMNLRLNKKKKLPNELAHVSFRWQMMRIYIDTWVLWVRINILRYPPFDSERIFIASLCLVSVIFGALFESSLATVYIHPLYYKDINTMKDLDDSGLKILYKYSSMADDLFFSETSPLFASLNKKLQHVSNLNTDLVLEVALYGGKASVTRQITFRLESLPYVLAKKIWMVPECPKYYTISYALPKDSPIEEAVNRLLLRALHAGLIGKWINEFHTKVILKIMNEHHFETNDIFKVLKVTDLQLAFYVVVFGSFLGGCSLLMEIYLKRTERKNKNRRK